MKTTSESQIEKMSWDWRGFSGQGAFKAGYKACEAKMLAEASEGFGEWYYDESRVSSPMSINSTLKEVQEISHKDAFIAGAMSQAKRDAERIKQLEDALRETIEELRDIAKAQRFDGKYWVKDSFLIEKYLPLIKQGGEK